METYICVKDYKRLTSLRQYFNTLDCQQTFKWADAVAKEDCYLTQCSTNVCLKEQWLVCRGCAWFSSKSPIVVIPFILPAPGWVPSQPPFYRLQGGTQRTQGLYVLGKDYTIERQSKPLAFLFNVVVVCSYIYEKYMCVYIHMHICTCTHIYVHIYMYVCMHTHIHIAVSGWPSNFNTFASASQVRDYRYLSKSLAWSPFFFKVNWRF